MPVQKDKETTPFQVASGIQRKAVHLERITTAVIDFSDGPHPVPAPPHSHPHEQITYVARGELYVFIGEDRFLLSEGDLFSVPPEIPHTVQILSSSARLVDSFTPVREDFREQ